MDIITLNDAQLRPVVELEPFQYQRQGRTSPTTMLRDSRDAWAAYWRESLADSGIRGLQPIAHGSWFVETRRLIDPDAIRTILKRRFEGTGLPGFPDDEGRQDAGFGDRHLTLDGGYALCSGDEVLVEPTCCGDLGNLSDWEGAAAHESDAAEMLWIGHPWLMVRACPHRSGEGTEWLVLAETSEYPSPAELREFRLRPSQLRDAIGAARSELDLFRKRLRPILEEIFGEKASSIVAKLLTARATTAP